MTDRQPRSLSESFWSVEESIVNSGSCVPGGKADFDFWPRVASFSLICVFIIVPFSLVSDKTRAAGASVKPGVKRSGTPGTTIIKNPERAKRAIAKTLHFTNREWLSPTLGSSFLLERSWGFASLHPRLYAIAALRGLSHLFHHRDNQNVCSSS